MKTVLFNLAIASCSTFAQITIESSDVSNWYAAGKVITTHEDTSLSTVNIGAPGGGNNWDFTSLKSHYTNVSEGVDAATSPHIGYFPGANSCSYQSSNYDFGGEEAQVWNYSSINPNWDNLGFVLTINSQPGNIYEIKNTPPSREVEFPVTYNYNRPPTNYSQTTKLNGMLISTTDYTSSLTVDAYGSMTLPGGANFEALRIRYSESNTEGDNYVDYTFITKTGAQVNIYCSDTNPPTSGIINTNGGNYNGVPTITGIEQISELPNNYILSQNYPNPFNPSTKINYSIPKACFVSLKVYDVLGKEVSTLVGEYMPAGNHGVEFNASGLTNGIYFYRLEAVNYQDTKKLIVLK